VATLPNSASQADTRRRPRRLTSLFSRVLITNTVLLALAPLAAGFLRASGKGHFDGRFALVAGLPLLVLWVMNFYFLRGAFTPLRTLSEFADRVELLRPGRRLELESRTAEIVVLTDAMNRMLARLEQEQRSSTRRAVAAQESERQRIAQELHDEVGQTLTAVLLEIPIRGAEGRGLRIRPEISRRSRPGRGLPPQRCGASRFSTQARSQP
jgi:two-component system sensor histidine kinase UhpB